MRKYAVAGSLLLLLLLGTVAHISTRRPPAVILFEPPLHAPRLPGAHVETEVEGGRNSPLRAPRIPKPVKRRGFLPPMVARSARVVGDASKNIS